MIYLSLEGMGFNSNRLDSLYLGPTWISKHVLPQFHVIAATRNPDSILLPSAIRRRRKVDGEELLPSRTTL